MSAKFGMLIHNRLIGFEPCRLKSLYYKKNYKMVDDHHLDKLINRDFSPMD